MPDQPSTPESHSPEPADRPLSRRERRGKTEKSQSVPGRVHGPGRTAVPASKHMNYRRG
ncbi:hypothetical protein [Nocardia sp. NPDC005978]|uniref:hypothetical protein n=1 Tax=unclassified Nocardia TaxID=2637762 RepID=UPI0033A9BAAD